MIKAEETRKRSAEEEPTKKVKKQKEKKTGESGRRNNAASLELQAIIKNIKKEPKEKLESKQPSEDSDCEIITVKSPTTSEVLEDVRKNIDCDVKCPEDQQEEEDNKKDGDAGTSAMEIQTPKDNASGETEANDKPEVKEASTSEEEEKKTVTEI